MPISEEQFEGNWKSWDEFTRQWLSENTEMENWPELAQEFFDFDLFSSELRSQFLVVDKDGEILVYSK